MEDGLIDNELSAAPKETALAIIRWWEKKRLLFNAIIIGVALIVLFQGLITHSINNELGLGFIIQSIVYLIFINCCYCVGWGLQLVRYYYFNVYSESHTLDFVLFTLGTLFTGVFTYFGFMLYLRYH